MNLIIPMAGRGSRLRPHTLTVPKPLVHVAGKPIVQHLVEDLAAMSPRPFDNIAFVIGDFGEAVEADLLALAAKLGAKGHIRHQDQPLGTAHAVWCAKELLEGETVVAFADTLFRADFQLNAEADGHLFVKRIEDPRQFGVVVLDGSGAIVEYAEKPETPVSDLAMIGIYHFRDGAALRREIDVLIDTDMRKGGEFQLPDAFRALTEQGARFMPGEVDDWMDCGNRNATVETNGRMLEFLGDQATTSPDATVENSVIIPPCIIQEGAVIRNAVVGPRVTIGPHSCVEDSLLRDCLIGGHSHIEGARLTESMVGNHVRIVRKAEDISLGDYSEST
ncbi:MAG: NTP transferase domain-containing protein [Flavobacteriales bacterium]|nr:NTP transferase domain-containing protein [Flavobacteriales bacterium]